MGSGEAQGGIVGMQDILVGRISGTEDMGSSVEPGCTAGGGQGSEASSVFTSAPHLSHYCLSSTFCQV